MGAGKCLNGREKIRAKKSQERKEEALLCIAFLTLFRPNFFLARLDFFPPPLTASGSPRMVFFLEGNTFLLLEVCGVYFHCFRCLSSRSERLFGGFRRRCCGNASIEGTGFNLVAPTPPSKGTERILVCLVTFQLFRRQAAIHRIRRSRSGIPAA